MNFKRFSMSVLFSLTLASSAFAGSLCKIQSNAYVGAMGCEAYSTRLYDLTEDQCRAATNRTRAENFFGKAPASDRIVKSKFVFKENGRTVKETIEFEEGSEDLCYTGIY
jgi:hypothetical protein